MAPLDDRFDRLDRRVDDLDLFVRRLLALAILYVAGMALVPPLLLL